LISTTNFLFMSHIQWSAEVFGQDASTSNMS
jgi:hypothetical protein